MVFLAYRSVQKLTSFTNPYARIYDLLHRDKPYEAEVERVTELYLTQRGNRPRRVLDLACGTARHAKCFAEQGAMVLANDASAAMLEVARARTGSLPVKFSCQRMQELELEEEIDFDLVTAYYTALGYLSDPDRDRLFARLARWMSPGALFFADLWNADRMAGEYSPQRERIASDELRRVRRVSSVRHLEREQALEVCFDFEIEEGNARETFRERHVVRYDRLPELAARLERHGFRVVASGPFFELETELRRSFNFFLLARREGER